MQLFYCLFVYVLLLAIQLSEGEGWDPITGFALPYFCACP